MDMRPNCPEGEGAGGEGGGSPAVHDQRFLGLSSLPHEISRGKAISFSLGQ